MIVICINVCLSCMKRPSCIQIIIKIILTAYCTEKTSKFLLWLRRTSNRRSGFLWFLLRFHESLHFLIKIFYCISSGTLHHAWWMNRRNLVLHFYSTHWVLHNSILIFHTPKIFNCLQDFLIIFYMSSAPRYAFLTNKTVFPCRITMWLQLDSNPQPLSS